MEQQFLFARDWLAVPGGGVECPLPDCGDYAFVDTVTDAALHGELSDFSIFIDDDVEDDIAFGAVGQLGEIGSGGGKDSEEGDADVAGTQGVVAGGAIGGAGCGRGGVERGGLRLRLDGFLPDGERLESGGMGIGQGDVLLRRGPAGRVSKDDM